MRASHLIKDVGGLALYGWGPEAVRRLTRRELVRLADALGDLVRISSPGDVALAKQEHTATWGDHPTAGLLARAWRLRMLVELEVLRYPTLDPSNIEATARLEGRHHLDQALSAGRGAVVMIGHLGANQLIMPALGHRGYPMHQLSAPPTAWFGRRRDGRENRLWRRVQQRRWALERSLPAQHIDVFSFLRPAYAALERNEVLGLAFDGGGGSRWSPVPLGQRTAWVPTQPWQLVRSTGAQVVPAVVVHAPGDTAHRVVLDAPFTVERTHSRDDDIGRAVLRYAAWFNERARERPDHYLPYLLLRRRVRDTDAQPFFSEATPR